MTKNDPAIFHKLYGMKKPRVVYYKNDFLDYLLMIALSALAIGLSYGLGHVMSIVGLSLCVFTLVTFTVRHGIGFSVPVALRRPQDVLYMFAHKFRNLKPAYFAAVGALLLENLLIAATPNLPHHTAGMRTLALGLFYFHFLFITTFRTVILVDHLAKKELVREVLMQTAWQRAIKEDTNITLEILHAYCTGVLTHIILIAPWYLVITHFRFSLVLLPAACLVDAVIHMRWLKVMNAWFYRDHWLGHNSEFQFLFIHGTHHDAIPSGLIAVAENGFLEGFLRFTIGYPVPFYNPVVAFVVCTYDVKKDIDGHQYIPGIYPQLSKELVQIVQHSTHHYGPLEPYGLGLKLDQPEISEKYKRAYKYVPDEIMNSIKLDEDLTGFKWDNPTHRRLRSLYEKYHNRNKTA